jgi:ribosomal protein S18 acetylase RimI-like enzyme
MTVPDLTVRRAVPADAPDLTRLQRAGIWWNNLSPLGDPFNDLMHRQFIRSRHALVFVAERRGRVVGHVVWTLDSAAFHREFMWKRGWLAGLLLLPKLLRASTRRTILRSLTYYPEVPADDPKAEAVSWVVDPAAQRGGIGQALMQAVKDECRRRGIDRIKAGHVNPEETYTNAAYRRAGFKLVRSESFYDGVAVNVYWCRLSAAGGPGAAHAKSATGSTGQAVSRADQESPKQGSRGRLPGTKVLG